MKAMRSALPIVLVALLGAGSVAGQTTKDSNLRRGSKSGQAKELGASNIQMGAGSVWAGEPISLDLKDADFRDVLHTFSSRAGLNIVVDPEVKGSVTVRLRDVPWDQALDLIIRSDGF